MNLTLKEMNRRIFQRKAVPSVFFQPRFEPWYSWHKQFDSLPAEVRSLDVRDVFDHLGVSMRYMQYKTGKPSPVQMKYSPKVKLKETREGHNGCTVFETPYGELKTVSRLTEDRAWRTTEFKAKTPEDLKPLRWLIEQSTYRFNLSAFKDGAAFMGERGVPQFFVPKSPYFAMAQTHMKYEDFIYALMDYPQEMEDVMKAIDAAYEPLYEQMTAAAGELEIVNFGENIAVAYLSAEYFEKYCIPWYQKRCGQLRNAGIFTHIHIDGDFKPLLPYLRDLPFDGLEALTPEPQGDVTLDEIRENIGDKILLDGIPAVYFLRHHSREELQACTERLIKYFHPRLVLGISDELPQGCDDEGYERLKWLAAYCRKTGGNDVEVKQTAATRA
jgi:hypothetical protein